MLTLTVAPVLALRIGRMPIRMLVMVLTLMCMVIIFAVIVADENEDSLKLLEFKLQVIQFSVPYYFFFMVFVALFFSAHTFYTGLRNALFPQLRENDD